MDEHADFEARAVLAPRRARGARLALLVPVLAFVAIAFAGLNGPRSDSTAVASPDASAAAVVRASPAVEVADVAVTAYPTEAIGLAVQRLGEVQVGRLSFDSVVAIAGWYVPTAVTDCPPIAAIYRDGALPYVRGDTDKLAFCVRSGILYPSPPKRAINGSSDAVPAGVATTVVVGVLMPLDLETVGKDATQVVVIGRFGKISDGCLSGVGCSREFLIDHVAWTPSAS
jgi:hypothetical protein